MQDIEDIKAERALYKQAFNIAVTGNMIASGSDSQALREHLENGFLEGAREMLTHMTVQEEPADGRDVMSGLKAWRDDSPENSSIRESLTYAIARIEALLLLNGEKAEVLKHVISVLTPRKACECTDDLKCWGHDIADMCEKVL